MPKKGAKKGPKKFTYKKILHSNCLPEELKKSSFPYETIMKDIPELSEIVLKGNCKKKNT